MQEKKEKVFINTGADKIKKALQIHELNRLLSYDFEVENIETHSVDDYEQEAQLIIYLTKP